MSNNIERSSQEKRTAFVVIFAFCVMIAEVIVGLSSHSMALFADGVHLGSHVLVSDLTGLPTYSYEDWRTREQLIMTQRKY